MSKQNAKVSGKHLGATYRRNKSHSKTEQEALDYFLKKFPKERKNNLTPAHTDKQWVFKAKTNFD